MNLPNPNIRRRKVVFVPERFILTFFNRSEFLNLPIPANLPPDVRAISAHHDFLRNAFAVVIEHESFEEVNEAVQLPEVEIIWWTVKLDVTEDCKLPCCV